MSTKDSGNNIIQMISKHDQSPPCFESSLLCSFCLLYLPRSEHPQVPISIFKGVLGPSEACYTHLASSTSDNSQNSFVWINSNTLVKVYNANLSTELHKLNRCQPHQWPGICQDRVLHWKVKSQQNRLFLSRTSSSTTRQNIVYSFVPSVSQICGRNIFTESRINQLPNLEVSSSLEDF
jgi:hypothetical protein